MTLPPKAGNQEIDRDIEDLPNELNENSVNLSSIFEPTGEVEVIDVKVDDFASASLLKLHGQNGEKLQLSCGKKAAIFDKDIPAELLGNFSGAYQHLLIHLPYEL